MEWWSGGVVEWYVAMCVCINRNETTSSEATLFSMHVQLISINTHTHYHV